MSPRENARRPAQASQALCCIGRLNACPSLEVEWLKFGAVLVGPLQVIAEDLLELEWPGLSVDPAEPSLRTAHGSPGPRALEQPGICGIADEPMPELEGLLLQANNSRTGRTRCLAVSPEQQRSRPDLGWIPVRSSSDRYLGRRSGPITDPRSTTAR